MENSRSSAVGGLLGCLAFNQSPSFSCSQLANEIFNEPLMGTSETHRISSFACLAAAKSLTLSDRGKDRLGIIRNIRFAAKKILTRQMPYRDIQDPGNHQFIIATTTAVLAMATLVEEKTMPDRLRKGLTNDLNRYVAKLCKIPNAKSTWVSKLENAHYIRGETREKALSLFAAIQPK